MADVGNAIVLVSAFLPLAIAVYALVLLRRIAVGVDRMQVTLERGLPQIEGTLPGTAPGADPSDDDRWPPES